jgi:soluble lytic murein transglycosylase-like protein
VRTRLFAFVVVAVALAAPLSAAPLATSAFPVPVPHYLGEIINDAAAKYHVDPNLIAAMAFRESRFDAGAVSSRGAQGIMQLMPRTAAAMGVRNAFDPRDNVFGATRYLASLLQRFHGNVDLTLAAYNAGPELVAKVGPAATPEAVDYVAAVKSFYLAALRAL